MKHTLSCRPTVMTNIEQRECMRKYKYGYVWFCEASDVECIDRYVSVRGQKAHVTMHDESVLFNLGQITHNEHLRAVIATIPSLVSDDDARRLPGYPADSL